jgi:hypothetical protein
MLDEVPVWLYVKFGELPCNIRLIKTEEFLAVHRAII